MRLRRVVETMATLAASVLLSSPGSAQSVPPGRIELRSSHAALQKGFAWAKSQSLA